ncbi:transmembrane channel-like protein 6b [Neoarius graeffei]|uniref:transmembrane channel-like protein 6b n=1 Tax=Neoarius graeffei TaxID=443677 RepID=UPI00298D0E50|nr:transmembrane channel-like protein 6b [Neoarius graeffei]XP_060796992.1 transmembrane channel-like protein 6b [Neoarius graeffei]XP_060796993.1 transmembrane channel-like protein 6b [Neoarius graeffei]XP_060796994.1 transmembrane channel-like protein 6b [Neoarius graeffei]XP_060796995.1 transmembrane channel-like protein 6b [Neoarius graeffei]XP_060796996.1 transmembrane channel-like protein 6b [Neoarius graeffei]XP_060796997.1 transmembrane channel-like protein 6b [Neoarius graeffei]XP_0
MAAHSISFDTDVHFMEPGLESPMDENVVHDSFSKLIQEQSQDLDSQTETIEMYPLREEPEDDFSSFAIDEYGGTTEPLVDERWSSDTLRVLSSMPSRTIGRSRGAILSQYYARTMQMCRHRQSRPSIHSFSHSARPSIRGYPVDSNVENFEREEDKKAQLVKNLQNLSVGDRVRMLKAIPLNMTEKIELRRLASNKTGRSTYLNRVPCCSHFRDHILITLRQSWYSWLSFVSSLRLWQTALKTVSGRFGTGVLSYFVFLRKLFFFNVFLFMVTGFFLVIPQAVRHERQPYEETQTSDSCVQYGLEVLTGTGCFKESLMYYGYYSNYTFTEDCKHDRKNDSCGTHLSYNMSLAYFFTIGMAFFITCIILVYSMSKSFGQSFRIDRSKGLLAIKVFSSWDFKVLKKSSVQLQSEDITTQLRELVAEVNRQKVKSPVLRRVSVLCIQLLAWIICIGSTVVCSLGVYYFSDYVYQHYLDTTSSDLRKETRMLVLPVVVSSINLLLPGFFNVVAWMEEYESPSTPNYVAIFRNLMLKVSMLGVLCHHWLGKVASGQKKPECWESFVGQELYRFLLMDFIFTMLDSFFGEFLWRLFSQKALKRERKPVFDIARNVLELIYGQTLAWLGVLFTPLLPAVQVIKLFLLFYMKKTSLMMNCQAPRKPWRASQMTTFFITLLCFPSFLGASVCVTYTMWTIKPSDSCGPFRGLNTMFQAGKKWVEALAHDDPYLTWLTWVHTYLVENPFFLFLASGIFLIIIYFHSQVVDGQRKIIELLQEQIENEGEDKKFLITRLQDIHEQKRPQSQHHSRTTREESSIS